MLEASASRRGVLTCTASLIAPNLAITARHCVGPVTEGLFTCNERGELDYSENGAGRFDPEHPAGEIALWSSPRDEAPRALGEEIFSLHPVHVCTNDIALIVLDRAVDLPVLPLRRAPASPGERITLVGFGSTGAERAGEKPERLRRGSRIDQVGPDSLVAGAGEVAPRVFTVQGTLGCPGDSGGPAISDDGAVLGVYSLQQGELCDDEGAVNYFTHVAPFRDLVARAFERAGATPTYSDDPSPEPAPGSAGAGGEAGETGSGGSAGAASAGPADEPVSSAGALSERSPEGDGCAFERERPSHSALWIALALGVLGVARRRSLNAAHRADQERAPE